jgi:hypothetical protein
MEEMGEMVIPTKEVVAGVLTITFLGTNPTYLWYGSAHHPHLWIEYVLQPKRDVCYQNNHR